MSEQNSSMLVYQIPGEQEETEVSIEDKDFFESDFPNAKLISAPESYKQENKKENKKPLPNKYENSELLPSVTTFNNLEQQSTQKQEDSKFVDQYLKESIDNETSELPSVTTDITRRDEGKAVKMLRDQYSRFGFDFDEAVIGRDVVKITASNGESMNFKIDKWTLGQDQDTANQMTEFMNANKINVDRELVNKELNNARRGTHDDEIKDQVTNAVNETYENEAKRDNYELELQQWTDQYGDLDKVTTNVYENNRFVEKTLKKPKPPADNPLYKQAVQSLAIENYVKEKRKDDKDFEIDREKIVNASDFQPFLDEATSKSNDFRKQRVDLNNQLQNGSITQDQYNEAVKALDEQGDIHNDFQDSIKSQLKTEIFNNNIMKDQDDLSDEQKNIRKEISDELLGEVRGEVEIKNQTLKGISEAYTKGEQMMIDNKAESEDLLKQFNDIKNKTYTTQEEVDNANADLNV